MNAAIVNRSTTRPYPAPGTLTRYEIVAVVHGRDCRFLLGYVLNWSKGRLLDTARRFGDALIAEAGLTDSDAATYTRDGGWAFGDKLTIRRGRTEREALSQGEFPTLREGGATC